MQHTTLPENCLAANDIDTPKRGPTAPSMLTDHTDSDDSGARDCRCVRARHRRGTRDAYLRDRCRCPACRTGNSAHQREFRRARAVHAWHGTSAWVDAVGTRRRLQALSAAGWSASQLAHRLGVSRSAVAQLRRVKQDRVLAATASDVAVLYDTCWWRTPPGSYQARSERYADERGRVPPWRWDGVAIDDPAARPVAEPDEAIDDVAIDETIAGRRVRLTKAERHRLVERMQRCGASSAQIADRLGCSARTVERYEAVLRKRHTGAA